MDMSTGLASRTGNFGFISDSQVDLKAGTLALHRTSALDGIYRDAGNTAERPSWQVNLRLSLADVKLNRRDWGAEAGLDWARFKDASIGSGGGEPARAHRHLRPRWRGAAACAVHGPFSPLPGDQRIGDTPTRSNATVAGSLNGSRSFSAKTTIFRLVAGGTEAFGRRRARAGGGQVVDLPARRLGLQLDQGEFQRR
jgi:hypothetical protein